MTVYAVRSRASDDAIDMESGGEIPDEQLLSRKNIAFVAMNYAPEIAGCGKYTGDVCRHLASLGHKIKVVTSPPHYPGWAVQKPYQNNYSKENLHEIEVYRCPLLIRRNGQGIWRLVAPASFAISSVPLILRTIFGSRPDRIVLVEPTMLVAPFVLIAAAMRQIPTVLYVQDLEVDAAFAVGHIAQTRWLKYLSYAFERLCITRFDQVITISNRMVEKLAAKGVDSQRLAVVRNGVDLAHISPRPIDNGYRAELGLKADDFVVLYSGNIGRKQGLEVVIEAARQLQHIPRLVFAISGDGPSLAQLRTLATDLPNVRFLPFQPYGRLGDFLAICNAHIMPQLADAADLVLPSKLAGILASGRPLIYMAEPATELASFIGEAGFRVEPENTAKLCDGLTKLMNMETRPMVEHGLSLVRQLSSAKVLAELTALLVQPPTSTRRPRQRHASGSL